MTRLSSEIILVFLHICLTLVAFTFATKYNGSSSSRSGIPHSWMRGGGPINGNANPVIATNYDYTEQINDALESGQVSDDVFEIFKKPALLEKKSFYYSTDALLSEIGDLKRVADLTANITQRNSSLLISFRLTKENGELDPRRFQDLLQGIAKNYSVEELDSIRNQVSGIVLDWSHDDEYFCDERNSLMNYTKRLNISFTQYAQKLVGVMLGTQDTSARIPVGVSYNDRQLHCDFLRTQVAHADFVVFQVNFNTFSWVPLSFQSFKKYMGIMHTAHERFLYGDFFNANASDWSRMSDSTEETKRFDVMYMFTLEKDKSLVERLEREYLIDEKGENVTKEILHKAEAHYWLIIKDLIVRWRMENWDTVTEIVLKSFDYLHGKSERNIFSRHQRESEMQNGMIPYLYIHETDVTSCVLKSMISDMFFHHDIVINEYTWNALVRLQDEMERAKYHKTMDKCQNISTYESLEHTKTHLLVSDGIADIWDHVSGTFETLLMDHGAAAGLKLDTVIFSAKDIYLTACGDSCTHSEPKKINNPNGIIRFLDKIGRNANISVGCLVDFGRIEDMTPYMSQELNQSSAKACGPVLNRKQFMKHFSKNVTIQLQPIAEDFYGSWATDKHFYCTHVYDLYNNLEQWGQIHDVRFILRPLFDTKYPLFGLRNLPNEDSGFSYIQSKRCAMYASGVSVYY